MKLSLVSLQRMDHLELVLERNEFWIGSRFLYRHDDDSTIKGDVNANRQKHVLKDTVRHTKKSI